MEPFLRYFEDQEEMLLYINKTVSRKMMTIVDLLICD
jgi:hypothetical protein